MVFPPSFQTINFEWQQLVAIILFYAVAWLVHKLAQPFAGRIVRVRFIRSQDRRSSDSRQTTLRGLLAGVITFLGFIVATVGSLSLFVDAATLVWSIGLFSAAFGLGARPLVSDFLAGMSFIFEDSFDVGEKIQLSGLPGGTTVEGVVDAVNLRTTTIRAMSGQPFIVPNGEIRVICNFSRGRYSTTTVRLKFSTAEFQKVTEMLETLASDAVGLLPNLLEPWQLITESDVVGEVMELTIIAKARFGTAAEMRPRLITLVQEKMKAADIVLVA